MTSFVYRNFGASQPEIVDNVKEMPYDHHKPPEITPWRPPPLYRPIKRWKSKLRVIKWGKHIRTRPGNPYWSEPETVEYEDYASYIRFWPNPGFTIRGFHWCRKHKE